MPKLVAPGEIAGLIGHGSRVFIQGGMGEPREILTALAANGQNHKAVEYFGVSIPGINNFSPHTFHAGARFHTFFMHQDISPLHKSRVLFHPLHYRDIYRFLGTGKPFDVSIIQVSPPDADGQCSLGHSVDFVSAILNRSHCVVAEINAQYLATADAPSIAYQDLDMVVNTDRALPSFEMQLGGDVETAIARHVAALIEDGSCLQFGIGKLPGSILHQLHGHRHLGLHSGLISEDAKELISKGIITGEKKNLDRGRHVAGLALGGKDFYHWVASHPKISFRSVDYTHDHRTLASIDQFVSINSALEVDLQGQANAERVRGRAVSASGGLVDFVRGARASRGGKSILALPATAMRGKQSRVVATLGASAITTLCRTDIDYVVTEYGSASLFTLDTEQRAVALTEIAQPEFREELWQAWEKYQS